ncbi:MAG: hypothetical protein IPM77_15670 [Crocinitomicaceae bacterium]|nr:hypothetical protein [Crocinitomicaceae bacterium]
MERFFRILSLLLLLAGMCISTNSFAQDEDEDDEDDKKKKLPEEVKRKNISAKEEMLTAKVSTGKQNPTTTKPLLKALPNHNTGLKPEWFIMTQK